MRTAWRCVAIGAVLGLWGSPALGQNFGMAPTERYFHVEHQAAVDRQGRPVVFGYVYNDGGGPADDLRVLVESLDGSGRVVATAVVLVSGAVGPMSRVFFEARGAAPAASYRARVIHFNWIRVGEEAGSPHRSRSDS